MKKISFIIVIMFLSIICYGQNNIKTLDISTRYNAIVSVDSGIKKDQLYKNCKVFFAEQFKSSNNMIQYDDKAEGKVIGKGLFEIWTKKTIALTPLLYNWRVYFTIEVDCKDGKYRYMIHDFNIKQQIYDAIPTDLTLDEAYSKSIRGSYKKIYIDLLNQSSDRLNGLTETINSYMNMTKSSDDF